MDEIEKTCGQELAENAVVPEQFGALFTHVARNLRAHALWTGTETEPARLEHDAMLAVAGGYEEIGAAAQRTASLMRSFAALNPVAHDPRTMDRREFVSWMRTKVVMQRQLAALLLEHAEQSERALEEIASQTVGRP